MIRRTLLLTALTVLIATTAFAAVGGVPAGSLDHEFARMAEEVPGFGGLYYDEDGFAHVYLTDPSRAATLGLGDDVVVHEAEFDFPTLQAWRINLRDLLADDAVVTLDVDERTNRIQIGVDRSAGPEAIWQLRSAVAFNLVPSEAVTYEKADPIYMAATLQDRVRPVVGGLQINFGNFLCTLGFNAVRNGVSGFVTNSHCTGKQGGVEGTEYFQPLSPDFIGTEIADPEYLRSANGCPRGKKCRFSDSAFAQYDPSVSTSLGEIARTESRGNLEGSLTIDASSPTFTISGTGSSAVGEEVNKIGRTTGWTFGPVDSTCVDVAVAQSNKALLCQDIVLGGVGGGDSGSPVFSLDGSGSVTLRGILWGGNSAGDLFVYSPFANITDSSTELGALSVN